MERVIRLLIVDDENDIVTFLSTWFRDYVFIPLGGNRHGTYQTYRNLSLTMLLGGLWHGAAWSFVVWGGLHGVYLVLHRLLVRNPRDPEAPLAWRDAPTLFGHFHERRLQFWWDLGAGLDPFHQTGAQRGEHHRADQGHEDGIA